MALPLGYHLRNVLIRWRATVATVLGIALVVAVYLLVQALAAGLEKASGQTGDPRNLLVVRRGAVSESGSQIPREVYQSVRYLPEIERDARFSLRMLAGISRRLHGLVRDVEDYTLFTGAQRIIGYLLRDVDDNAEPGAPITVALPVSKATVASRLSLTPEYFSRVLHELESEGLIEIDKRDIRIRDPQRLAQYRLE